MSTETTTSEAGSASEGHPRRWVILAVLCLALLMVLLDNTVLNVAIPSITDALHAGTADIQWIINAYSLVLAGLLLTTGSLADRFGRKRSLLAGLVLFTAGSAVAAMSASVFQLIVSRGVMGVGAALFMPGTLAVLMQIFDARERPRAIAAWTAVASLGFALGPVIGGALLAHYWWGSVFVINIPIGLLAIIGIGLLVPESRDPRTRKPDIPGVLLSMVLGVALVYSVISVPEHGWVSADVLVPLAIGTAALLGFIEWERRVAEPMLDLTLFRNARFSGSVASSALVAFAMAGSLFLFTQYLQFVLGYTPLEAGFRTIPVACVILAVTPVSPRVAALIGIPLTLATGLFVIGAGFFTLSFVGTGTGYGTTLIGLVLVGCGVGFAMPTSANALMSAIPKERAGIASGLTSTLQEFGNSLGVAVLGSVMSAQFASLLPRYLPDGVASSVGLALGAAAHSPDPASSVRGVQDAFVSGISLSLTIGAGMAVVAGILAWYLLRKDGHDTGEVAPKRTPATTGG